jgi:hypothetical protein
MNWRWITRPHHPAARTARLLIADPEHPALDLEVGSSLDRIQAASVQYRIAIGPHAGRKALTLYSEPPVDDTRGRDLDVVTPHLPARCLNPAGHETGHDDDQRGHEEEAGIFVLQHGPIP